MLRSETRTVWCGGFREALEHPDLAAKARKRIDCRFPWTGGPRPCLKRLATWYKTFETEI